MSDDLMLKWYDYDFESSSEITPEFCAFVDDFKTFVRQQLHPHELRVLMRGHFFCSAFIKLLDGTWVHIVVPDVRYTGWFVNISFSRVDDPHDQIGTGTSYCTIYDLKTIPERIGNDL